MYMLKITLYPFLARVIEITPSDKYLPFEKLSSDSREVMYLIFFSRLLSSKKQLIPESTQLRQAGLHSPHTS
jgi:hypothetical protein